MLVLDLIGARGVLGSPRRVDVEGEGTCRDLDALLVKVDRHAVCVELRRGKGQQRGGRGIERAREHGTGMHTLPLDATLPLSLTCVLPLMVATSSTALPLFDTTN